MKHSGPFFLFLAFVGACSSLVDVDRTRLEEPDYCDNHDECDNGDYCDGAEQCVGRQCQNGNSPCLDDVICTVDICEITDKGPVCSHEARNERCTQDPVEQICDLEDGCRPVAGGS